VAEEQLRGIAEATSFCEQKKAKKPYDSGALDEAPSSQTTEPDSKNFLGAFFKKHCLYHPA
jgi:hypothetical protein